MTPATISTRRQAADSETTARDRILHAAFTAFMQNGYAATSTLEIATRARVSKRELYALVGNKQQMLNACITERARRLTLPADLPVPRNREILEQVLASVGTQLLREITDPTVVGVYRLAIAEALHAPEVARALDSIGRETTRSVLRDIMVQAQSSGVLGGDAAAELVERFGGLLLGNLLTDLLLGVAKRPSTREIANRARAAAAAFVQLHSGSPNFIEMKSPRPRTGGRGFDLSRS
jgi:AcrR family transcriptional regulator